MLPHEHNMVQYVGNKDTIGLKHILADKTDTLDVLKAVVRKDGAAYKKGNNLLTKKCCANIFSSYFDVNNMFFLRHCMLITIFLYFCSEK